MIPLPEADAWDATEMAGKVSSREVSAAELIEASIARIEERDPSLNAVIHELFDRARASARALPEGPLTGVPFLLKDTKLTLPGVPTAAGNRLLGRRTPARRTKLAERYEEAGLVILGKTSTPEFGILGVTEPRLHGPTRNPWSLDHSPGGSSGGSAAAVAARMTPAAHGGDGGGSIRIPASACHLFGLKPSRGRVSLAPDTGEAWSGLTQTHALTRSVRDSALLLDIADAPTPGEPYAQPPKRRPWVEELEVDPGRLRVAFTTDTLLAGELHPDCVRVVEQAAGLLEDMGHELLESRPALDRAALVRAYFTVVAGNVARAVDKAAALSGGPPRHRDFEPETWALAQIGWKTGATEHIAAMEVTQDARRTVAAFYEGGVDLWLTATVAQPPPRIGELAPGPADRLLLGALRWFGFKPVLDRLLEERGHGMLARSPNTQLFNQTGDPAMSLPMGFSSEGLPLGVQIAAPFGREDLLFQLAARVEEARPWAGELPPMLR